MTAWVRRSVVCGLVATVAMMPGTVALASDELSSLILTFFQDGFYTLPGPPVSHDPTVFSDQARARSFGTVLNAGIATQFGNYPLSSSAGGFTFETDPETGLPKRVTETFGSLYVERALTIGKGSWNFGVAYSRSEFDTIDGFGLQSGDLKFNFWHMGVEPDTNPVAGDPFASDLIQGQLYVDLSLETASFYASYGVTRRLDLGIVLPYVRSTLDARMDASILQLGGAKTGSCTPTTSNPCDAHQFATGDFFARTTRSDTVSGSASGLGDVVVRVKYNFLRKERGGLAVALDLRAPTGNESDFLGIGATQARFFLAGSNEYGKIEPHINLGYTFSSGESDLIGELPDEINYAAGLGFAAGRRVTLFADVLGRRLQDVPAVRSSEILWRYMTVGGNAGENTIFLDEVVPETTDISLIQGSVGFKANVGKGSTVGGLLLNGSLLFPLVNDQGLVADMVFVAGLEYAF